MLVLLDLHYRMEELIETLWNVNDHAPVLETLRLNELIETLWNVNFIHGTTSSGNT